MKNTFLILLLFISTLGFSQVIIGDKVGTAANHTSVLLEFANKGDRGLILPYVTTTPAPIEGSIFLDATNATQAKVVYYNGSWKDLSSGNAANVSSVLTSQNSVTTAEQAGARVIIGDATSTTDGVLVLESTTKAMVLPMVTTVSAIANPAPGMMVYVNKTGSKRLAVYNGANWTFWMP